MFEKRFLYRTKEGPKVIIIGAGVSGMAAAARLVRNGFTNLLILEAEDRIGGRVCSVPLKDCVVDLGAHWVHGEGGNAVYELAKPLWLLGHSGDFSNVHFPLSNEREVDNQVGMEIFQEAGVILEDSEALNKCPGSLHDFVTDKCREVAAKSLGGDVLEAYMDWLIKFECTIEGCNMLTEPSARGLTHYKHCDGDVVLDWKGKGYSNVIDLLLSSVRDHKVIGTMDLTNKIHLKTEVEQIDYSGMGVAVKCKEGGIYFGDYVIVSVSLGVLKGVYKTFFYPPLPPEKRKAIMGLSIGTVNKIYLKFSESWWPEDCSGFSLLWLKDDRAKEKDQRPWEQQIIGFYTEASTPSTLTAWLVGEAARDMECYTTDQVKQGCMRVLRKFLGHKYDIPEPEDIARSSWFSNPHFRGSYSFRSLTTDALDVSAADLAKPLKNSFGKESVLFAGEATHDSYYSTVHGAIETGWREADYIITMDRESRKTVKVPSLL